MTRTDTLSKANEIVNGARQGAYGTPEDNFTRIAQFWTAYTGVPLYAEDVANMMILLKVARASSGVYCEDNYVDIAGYAACGGEIAGAKDTKAKVTEALKKYTNGER